jgi:hypothetical protein
MGWAMGDFFDGTHLATLSAIDYLLSMGLMKPNLFNNQLLLKSYMWLHKNGCNPEFPDCIFANQKS